MQVLRAGPSIHTPKELSRPRSTEGVCTAHVRAAWFRDARDLEQGEVPESLGHGIWFLEQPGFCLIPSPNLLFGGYSPLRQSCRETGCLAS